MGAFDAHGDGTGPGCRTDDTVNVVGASTRLIGITASVKLVPGACRVVQGSVHPKGDGNGSGLVRGGGHLSGHCHAGRHGRPDFVPGI